MSDPYITVEDADAYAAAEAMPAVAALLTAWAALGDDQKAALLTQASDEIDAARWQGRKFDLTQARQFPRLPYSLPSDTIEQIVDHAASGLVRVWDWDVDANEAIVPADVLLATWYQALSLLDPQRAARLDDRHDGVVGQGGGGVSQSFDPSRPANNLCRRAWTLLSKYRLKTGPIV